MPGQPLSGKLLFELRKKKLNLSRKEFVALLGYGWTEDILRHHEDGRTPLTEDRVADLAEKGLIKEGDEYYDRLRTAVEAEERQRTALKEKLAKAEQKIETTKHVQPGPTTQTHEPPAREGGPGLGTCMTAVVGIGLIVIIVGAVAMAIALNASNKNQAAAPRVPDPTHTSAPFVIIEDTRAAVAAESEPTVQLASPFPTPIPALSPHPTYAPKPTPTAITMPTRTPMPTTPRPEVLFEDDFNTGLKEQWLVVSGTPLVVDKHLTGDGDFVLWIGDGSWENYGVTFDIVESGCAWFWSKCLYGVGIRNTNGNMPVYRWANFESLWYTLTDDEWAEVPGTHKKSQRNVERIKVEVNGQEFAGAGSEKTSFYNNEFLRGGVALYPNSYIKIDNFKVTKLE